MKSLFTFILTLITLSTLAQSPDGINYQAICQSGSGSPLTSTTIGVEVNIIETTISGTIIYTESHSVTTNSNGVFAIEIGQGTPTTGTFTSIDWGSDSHFMEIGIDTLGGTSYVSMGTSEFLSTPYSFHSNTSNHSDTASYAISSGVVTDTITTGFTYNVNTFTFEVSLTITDPILEESLIDGSSLLKVYNGGTFINSYASTIQFGIWTNPYALGSGTYTGYYSFNTTTGIKVAEIPIVIP